MPNVEQWREQVGRELSNQGIPLPADLVLALMHVESRGKAGLVNPRSGASGLLQVMPNTLKWYNQATGDNVPLSWLRSPSHGSEQIRVGIWVLGQFWRSAYRYLRDKVQDIPTEELARIADLFYVAGPGATRKRLDKVSVPFYSYVAAKFPKWNALPHTVNVWKKIPPEMQWDLAGLSKWLEGHLAKRKNQKNGIIMMLVITLAGYWLFLRKGKSND